MHVQRTKIFLPPLSDKSFVPTEADYHKVRDDFSEQFEIPEIFKPTAPPYQPNNGHVPVDVEKMRKNNPQTELLCLMLGIRNPVDVILNRTIQPIPVESASATN